MRALLVAALVVSLVSPAIAKGGWACRNTIEVNCSTTSCAASGDFTPMDIHLNPKSGAIDVCAYTGCWTGKAKVSRRAGFTVFTASRLPFKSGDQPASSKSSIAITIDTRDGVGVIKVDSFAQPVNCVKD